jgi:hypothetical protein
MVRDKGGLDLDRAGSRMSGGRCFLVVGLVFCITLAVVVGSRMSAEAMAVVVGVVCGVAAGIPTSALLLVVMSRRDRQRYEGDERRAQFSGNPPVVVIQGGSPQALPPGQQAAYWPAVPPGTLAQRKFNMVGDEELVDDGWR